MALVHGKTILHRIPCVMPFDVQFPHIRYVHKNKHKIRLCYALRMPFLYNKGIQYAAKKIKSVNFFRKEIINNYT